jgi:hypothetical protein
VLDRNVNITWPKKKNINNQIKETQPEEDHIQSKRDKEYLEEN